MHILLIEPDTVQANTYVAALKRAGNSVSHVAGAQSAVQAADECTPDVVVLELQLPGHNGVEFLYEFRSYPEWLHIPVLLHTFVSQDELTLAVTLRHELNVRRALYKPTTSLAALCAAVQESVLIKGL